MSPQRSPVRRTVRATVRILLVAFAILCPSPRALWAQPVESEEARVDKLLANAKERFDAGDGPAAIDMIKSETHERLVKFREYVQKVVDATKAAQMAFRKNRLDEWKFHWGEVLGLVQDEKNAYHQKARREPLEVPTSYRRADLQCELGREALAEKRYDEAEKCFREALGFFPDHKGALEGLRVVARGPMGDFELLLRWAADTAQRKLDEGDLEGARAIADHEALRALLEVREKVLAKAAGSEKGK